MIDHIRTVTKFIESEYRRGRKYKPLLFFTFIDLKNPLDFVEKGGFIEVSIGVSIAKTSEYFKTWAADSRPGSSRRSQRCQAKTDGRLEHGLRFAEEFIAEEE